MKGIFESPSTAYLQAPPVNHLEDKLQKKQQDQDIINKYEESKDESSEDEEPLNSDFVGDFKEKEEEDL